MKIRFRITLIFTVLTILIVSGFASMVYWRAAVNREKEFFNLLEKEAVTKANLFLRAQIDESTLQEIYRNNREILNEVEVAVYDDNFQLIYHDAVEIDVVKETPEMLNSILQTDKEEFYQNEWQVVGLDYEFEGNHYIVTAAAYDEYGYKKLSGLLQSIFTVLIVSVLFIYLTGYYFSKRIFDPIKEMIARVKKISAMSLDLRLAADGSKDELTELAATFNEMLTRLEHSFEAQKQFVSHMSHELRTPLSAIIAELELSANQERTVEQYKEVIANALNDSRRLVRLSNSLLDLAKVNFDSGEINRKPVRVDEILLDAQRLVQQSNSAYKIDILFDLDSDQDYELMVNGNEYLLRVAFMNLMENACKFSADKKCTVRIAFEGEHIALRFKDQGIGIHASDLDNLFTPFFRGINHDFAEGNGIGLFLTKKIIELHEGVIQVRSQLEEGSTFHIMLKHL